MATFFELLFGSKFPSTAKFEAQQLQLQNDYNRYKDYEASALYNRFLELDVQVHAGEFEKSVQRLKNEKFKDTDAFRKLNQYLTLKKNKEIKVYSQFVKSGHHEKLDELRSSGNYLKFKELEMIINTPEFKRAKQQKGFKKTEESEQLKLYKKLLKSSEVKFVNKTSSSSEYATYTRVKDSATLKTFKELEQYIESNEFVEFKAYMEDPKRFEKSEEYKLLHEYEEIKKSENHKWFIKTKNANPFTELEKWKLTFEDDFDGTNFAHDKWMTGYYWGKALMNDHYVLAHEKQFFTDKNIETRDSLLKINTRKEACKGKIWTNDLGFKLADFNYTSGLISTGHSFRQQYGRFEAKVKTSGSFPLIEAFWMVGEKVVPQITILKTTGKNSKYFEAGTFLTEKNSRIGKVKATALNSDYHVIALEWSKTKLTWKINGVVVKEQTEAIPNEPMYMIFSTHLTEEVKSGVLPSNFTIDWVRCYQLNN
jgi:beta-glucanase (GH16 family)